MRFYDKKNKKCEGCKEYRERRRGRGQEIWSPYCNYWRKFLTGNKIVPDFCFDPKSGHEKGEDGDVRAPQGGDS